MTLSTPWMHAYLETIVCKFGGDLAICLREEAICAKVYRRTDDGRRAIALAHSWKNELKKGKGLLCPLVIAPHSRHGHLRGAQVHGAHRAASHIPALYLPSRSRYSFTEDGGLSKPRPRVQTATGPRLLRDSPKPVGFEPTTSRSLVEHANH